MTNVIRVTGLVAVVAVLVLAITVGCSSTGGSTTATSTGTGTGIDPATVSTLIQSGTETAVALGMVAIPDQTEANNIATLAEQVIDQNVLPALNGNTSSVTNGLQEILSLNAFSSNPNLAKVKMVLEAAMPILQNYIPAGLLTVPLSQVPPNVLANVKGFFVGARAGLADYLGKTIASKGFGTRDFTSYADLRAKLSAKTIVK